MHACIPSALTFIMHRIIFPFLCGYEQQPEQLCRTRPSQKDRRQLADIAALPYHGAQSCCHCSCTIDPIQLKFALSCFCIKFGPVLCVFTCTNPPAPHAGAGFKTRQSQAIGNHSRSLQCNSRLQCLPVCECKLAAAAVACMIASGWGAYLNYSQQTDSSQPPTCNGNH